MGVRSGDASVRRLAWDALVSAYWRPVYKYLRLQWRADAEQARDWTQEFFARALEKAFFDRFDPAKAHFRTFLRVCVDGMVGKEKEAERRLKRGGGVAPLSLDFATAEGELDHAEPPAPGSLDDYFRAEWIRGLFAQALADLEKECDESGKRRQFELFHRCDLEAPDRRERPSYAELAQEFSLPVTQVTNWLHATRSRLRGCVLARLRDSCASDDEFRAEAKALFGATPG